MLCVLAYEMEYNSGYIDGGYGAFTFKVLVIVLWLNVCDAWVPKISMSFSENDFAILSLNYESDFAILPLNSNGWMQLV